MHLDLTTLDYATLADALGWGIVEASVLDNLKPDTAILTEYKLASNIAAQVHPPPTIYTLEGSCANGVMTMSTYIFGTATCDISAYHSGGSWDVEVGPRKLWSNDFTYKRIVNVVCWYRDVNHYRDTCVMERTRRTETRMGQGRSRQVWREFRTLRHPFDTSADSD